MPPAVDDSGAKASISRPVDVEAFKLSVRLIGSATPWAAALGGGPPVAGARSLAAAAFWGEGFVGGGSGGPPPSPGVFPVPEVRDLVLLLQPAHAWLPSLACRLSRRGLRAEAALLQAERTIIMAAAG